MGEKEMLSQDLSDMFWDEESTTMDWVDMNDMIVEDETTWEEVDEETNTDDTSSWTEWVSTETTTWEEELDLSAVETAIEEVGTAIEEQASTNEENKATIESVTEALDNDNKDEAKQLIEQLYTQILQSDADLESFKTKYDVLNNKFQEISKELEEKNFKVEELSVNKVPSDPKLKIINRMYDDAKSGNESAKNRVISYLEDIYYELSGVTLEEKEVGEAMQDSIQSSTPDNTWIMLPEIEEQDEELNDGLLWIY